MTNILNKVDEHNLGKKIQKEEINSIAVGKRKKANSFEECFTERKSGKKKLITMSETKRTISLRQHKENESKHIAKLNPVILRLESSINNSELPLDLSIQSTDKPEPEKSDSIYERLIHLNMKERNAEEIKDITIYKENNSKVKEEERVSNMKNLLNQKYGESKLQSYTFTTDNEVKSVAALSIMPSKSFNLSEFCLTNIHSDIKNTDSDIQGVKENKVKHVMKKSFSVAQNLQENESSIVMKESANNAEDITEEIMNATIQTNNSLVTNTQGHTKVKRNNSNAIIKAEFSENRKIRNEVKTLYNFVKRNYEREEALSYDIEKNSNEFYNKIMEDSNADYGTNTKELLKDIDNQIVNGFSATVKEKSLQEKIAEITKELKGTQKVSTK